MSAILRDIRAHVLLVGGLCVVALVATGTACRKQSESGSPAAPAEPPAAHQEDEGARAEPEPAAEPAPVQPSAPAAEPVAEAPEPVAATPEPAQAPPASPPAAEAKELPLPGFFDKRWASEAGDATEIYDGTIKSYIEGNNVGRPLQKVFYDDGLIKAGRLKDCKTVTLAYIIFQHKVALPKDWLAGVQRNMPEGDHEWAVTAYESIGVFGWRLLNCTDDQIVQLWGMRLMRWSLKALELEYAAAGRGEMGAQIESYLQSWQDVPVLQGIKARLYEDLEPK